MGGGKWHGDYNLYVSEANESKNISLWKGPIIQNFKREIYRELINIFEWFLFVLMHHSDL